MSAAFNWATMFFQISRACISKFSGVLPSIRSGTWPLTNNRRAAFETSIAWT